MSVGLNASQARANSNQDLTIFNETQAIMKAIIADSVTGLYETTVSDGTAMTESTPDVVVSGTVTTPVIVNATTLIIEGVTITLGTTGTSLNAVIADINDAAIPNVLAYKELDQLRLRITTSGTNSYQYVIGAGTANSSLGLTAGTSTATLPSSVSYFNTWQGTETNRAKYSDMDSVIKHFSNLGYKAERTTNTVTSNTFSWYIYW
jgi:hypothetical protein|tara:strand:- start:775 stop:1392 length:618 start_codon:yes stop_codon:yes gene_type:complete